MSPFEGHYPNENSHSTIEIDQIIENYRNLVSDKLNMVVNLSGVQNDTRLFADFKEKEKTIKKNNEAALSTLGQALKRSYSYNTPYLKEKSIKSARSAYEITNRVNMKLLDVFLNQNNLTIDCQQ